MKKFTVYQIENDGRGITQIEVDRFDARRDVLVFGNTHGDVSRALQAGYYIPVAKVEARDLEHVFEIMNLWGEENEKLVERIEPLHSLSVGDIVEDENGVKNVVASIGFETLDGEPVS